MRKDLEKRNLKMMMMMRIGKVTKKHRMIQRKGISRLKWKK